ncbi:outer membrane porin GjpA [Mycobacterium sp.]|uniref:outer membrane porin GjpA n=1 Tax=Mycobacterium sp. TaxID=1785 RepID=UPI0031E098B7
MQLATPPWITAGVALVGAGSIAAIPVARPLPDLLDLQSRAVRLTSGETDLLSAWVTQFNDASANATILADDFGLAPGVGLQQAIVNQVGFLDQVINDPSSLSTVLTDFGNNLQNVLSSVFLVGASDATIKTVEAHTLDSLHGVAVSLLPSGLPTADQPAAEAIIQLLSSPASAMFIGDVGPFISPWVAGLNSIEAIATDLQSGDTTAAMTALVDAPANFVGAFFNGASLNLDALVPLLSQLNLLPAGTELTGLNYAFGGLFSPGSVTAGPYEFFNSSGTEIGHSIPAVGGSIFNSLGLNVDLGTTPIDIPGEPVGPIASLEGFSQAIGQLLGDGWDGKKPVPVPPLSTLTYPTLDASPASDAASILTADTLPADALPADAVTSLSSILGDLSALPNDIGNILTSLF